MTRGEYSLLLKTLNIWSNSILAVDMQFSSIAVAIWVEKLKSCEIIVAFSFSYNLLMVFVVISFECSITSQIIEPSFIFSISALLYFKASSTATGSFKQISLTDLPQNSSLLVKKWFFFIVSKHEFSTMHLKSINFIDLNLAKVFCIIYTVSTLSNVGGSPLTKGERILTASTRWKLSAWRL